MGGMDKSDPFTAYLAPPPNETVEEKRLREKREAEAQRVSDRIDNELKMEKAAMKKQKMGLVKVLILGQSESGKSTTLKSAFFSFSASILPLLHPSRFPHEIR